jgi:uncharacterized OsmC-like protein
MATLGINDVGLEALKATDKMVRENPALGKCVVKVRSTWARGTKTQVTLSEWYAGGEKMTLPPRRFTITVDEPEMLGGLDNAPFPPEVLLAALAGCVTNGTATNAAMFGVPIDGIEIEMEANIDVRGMLGHDKSVRNGITDINYTVTIQSSAPEDKVRKCKETLDRKSPIRDTLANPVNITSKFVYKPS